MEKKAVSGIMLTLLFIGMLTLAFNIQTVKSDWTWTETIYIRADGSVEPDTAPISTVDRITYTLTDNIVGDVPADSKAIVVGRDNIVVDGAGYTLQGTGAHYSKGIYLSGTRNVTIKNTKIKEFDFGIFLYESSNNRISGNNVTNTGYSGIFLDDSSNNNILSGNNIANSTSYGILFDNCSNNTLFGNMMNGNKYNFKVWGTDFLSQFMHSIDVSNLVNGKPVYYLVNQKDSVINSSTYPEIGYLAVINSTNIMIEGLTLMNNGEGLLLAYTEDSRITYNNITDNYYGVALRGCSNYTISGNNVRNNSKGVYLRVNQLSSDTSFNNTISQNNITDNGCGLEISASSYNDISNNKITNNGNGIYLFVSSKNTISRNIIISNKWMHAAIALTASSYNILDNNVISNSRYGIKLSEHEFFGASSNNSIFHNNFNNNTDQVHVAGGHSNVWDNGYPSGGNYWDDYCELDTDGDGIGDTPYVIDANNQDRYPLVVPLGPIPIVWDETIYPVELKSNSTISRFQFNASQKMISFNVTGPDGTLGFCNLTIPNSLVEDLWQGNYIVLVDEEEPITMNDWTNGTYTYIYLTYVHSTHEVTIIQEIPPQRPFWMQWWLWAIVAVVIVALAGAVYFFKKRKPPTPNAPPPPTEGTLQNTAQDTSTKQLSSFPFLYFFFSKFSLEDLLGNR